MHIYLISYQPSVKMWQCRIDGGTFDIHAQMTTEQVQEIPDYLQALKISASMGVDDMQKAAECFPSYGFERYIA